MSIKAKRRTTALMTLCLVLLFNPNFNRFISEDVCITSGSGLLSKNMFVYCGNNPITHSDPNGLSWQGILDFLKPIISTIADAGDKFLCLCGVDTAAIGADMLQFYESSPGVYHAKPDCWQKYFGYNDLYDVGFYLGTEMKSLKKHLRTAVKNTFSGVGKETI